MYMRTYAEIQRSLLAEVASECDCYKVINLLKENGT